ncbi:MAG TPA: hypothetical protein EYN19_01130 [Flavobacteriales bacterium]|nr:hypothetical protein [Flavobacteriales bacterium]
MENNLDPSIDPVVRTRTKLMMMYFILFSVTMMFGGFISAYIVSSLGQYWVHLTPTTALWISNGLIIASSVSMFLSLKMMRSGNPSSSKLYLSITLALGLAFSFSQYSGWNDLAQIGSGWGTESNEEGLVAYSWNRINELVQSDAVYGVDYDVRINDTPLLYNADTKEFYAPNDPLMVRAITSDVIHITNSSASYIWALILIHLLHLTFGIIYIVVNLIRVSKGIINPGDTVRLRVLSTYWHFLGGLWLLLFFVLFL